MTRDNTTRRRFLATSGATAMAAGLAGCTDRLNSLRSNENGDGNGNGNDTGNGNDSNGSEDGNDSDGNEDGNGVPALETEYNSREEYRQAGDSLDDFEDLGPWEVVQGSGEADEEVVFDGSQSFHLTAGEDENIVVERELSDVDLTDFDLSFAVRTTTPDRITINIRVVDSYGSERVYSLREITYRAPDVGWFRSSPGVFEESSIEPMMDDIATLQIQVLHSMPEAEVWVDDLRAVPTADTGYVMLSWDDASLDFLEKASPLHDEYGFSAVQAVVPRWSEEAREGIMSTSQLKERQEAGDQIVTHGTHSRMHEYDDEEQLEGRLRGDKNWLIQHEFMGADFIVYPHNSYDATSLEYISKYHYCGGFNQAGNVNLTNVHGFDPLALPRTIGHDLDISKRCVDLAAAYNQCTILNFHEFSANNTMPKEDYEELLAYIDESDVEVITFDELWEMRTSGN
ncbi:polysaccharide deacetylase family protein [Natronosalvus caseinilyticus]|uniref:polysaccharide deacetylase family protein n=1 Tax=Natronosalvus caseinilyticus TaxID=2953747 RepID=UPI0028B1F967|nr:polysaccharide deacetylase family protein [Natronosalvus caseinilyticus]